jgi:Ni/Co efflux regulator RcnB
MRLALAFAIAGILAGGAALADEPGKGKGRGKDRVNPSQQVETVEVKFGERERVIVREHYESEFRAGRCPPGLAKKNNGCLPPGQARKWSVGQPLPRDVVFYEVPTTLVVKIGLPPVGYRYVRVANDILMIALGTGIVLDAIKDLGRM